MTSLAELKQVACQAIDDNRGTLHETSAAIWRKRELSYEEHHAHDLCCQLLEKHGLRVERHYYMETAFRAVHGAADPGEPAVLVVAEYDALPEVGHACGHNLIAEAALGAGIGLKTAMEAAGKRMGKLIILGTPAEEAGGGKIKLIDDGAFEDATVAMMVHPWKGVNQVAIPGWQAADEFEASYMGKPSHAAAAPWRGVNALDAAVMAYNNISCLRQQIKPTWRIHAIITDGGTVTNIIPDKTTMSVAYRATSMGELRQLEFKVKACLEAAALATASQVVIKKPYEVPYMNLLTNSSLGSLYDANSRQLGIDICCDENVIQESSASTDMGNVSHVVPSIHPLFAIPAEDANHTHAFADAAGADAAQKPTLLQAKALAMTGLDVLWNPSLIPRIQKDFQDDLKRDACS